MGVPDAVSCPWAMRPAMPIPSRPLRAPIWVHPRSDQAVDVMTVRPQVL